MQNINTNAAVMFCNWLSHQDGFDPYYERTGKVWQIPTGEFEEWRPITGSNGYRLPTEAEWEYGCRSGLSTQSPLGDKVNAMTLDLYASGRNIIANLHGPGTRADPCGTKPPSGWGLYDLHGNVREWCWDWWQEYHGQEEDELPQITDPAGIASNGLLRRVFRDGIFYRTGIPFTVKQHQLGFRVVRTIESGSTPPDSK